MLRLTRAAFFNLSVNRLIDSPNMKTHRPCAVRVHSFDHDGCIGIPFLDPIEIPDMHTDLLDHLRKLQVQSPAIECMMIFSNRQSIKRDSKNAKHNDNNLALQVIPALAKRHKTYFDPLLLTDISINQKPGATLCRLIDIAQKERINLSDKLNAKELERLTQLIPEDYVYSTDKVNILYAQVHRASCVFPHARIEFNVYDDLSETVLTPCYQFYRLYPELLPENIVVKFIHYDTVMEGLPQPHLLYTLKGTGNMDPLYYQTIKKMEQFAVAEEGEQRSEYTFSSYLSPEVLLEHETIVSKLR